MDVYERVFRDSVEDPESFWLRAAEAIDWQVAPTRALDATQAPFYHWFPDGELNVSYNALDRTSSGGAAIRRR